MLTLIHGDDIAQSRKALDELKTKYAAHEKIIFDGTTVNLTDIISATDSLSLFGEEKLIVIENLVSGVLSKEKEKILDILKDPKSTLQIVLWEQKEITKLTIKKYFSDAKIIFCQVPPILFKFLDSLGEKPISQVLSMFHNLILDRGGEIILSMLIRQWRNLIIAADLGEKGFTGLPPWQAYKFIKQVHYFKPKNLELSYRQLLSVDARIKMGLSPYNINQLLDIFLISLYYQN